MIKRCEGRSIEDILTSYKEQRLSESDIESEIKKIISEKKGLSISAYMGLLMNKFKGKIDGKKLMDILSRYVN